jgi:hypothetical protein
MSNLKTFQHQVYRLESKDYKSYKSKCEKEGGIATNEQEYDSYLQAIGGNKASVLAHAKLQVERYTAKKDTVKVTLKSR